MSEIKHEVFGSVGVVEKEQTVAQKMAMPDLRELIELGSIKEDITIDNLTFSMRSLNSVERYEAAKYIGDDPDGEKLFEFNFFVLSMSVESVNGVLLDKFYNGPRVDNALEAKQKVLKSMQSSVIGKLLDFYIEITNRADSKYTSDQIKK